MKLNQQKEHNHPKQKSHLIPVQIQFSFQETNANVPAKQERENPRLKFSFSGMTNTVLKNSRSLENQVYSGESANSQFNLQHCKLSGDSDNKMEPNKSLDSRPRENSQLKFAPMIKSSGEGSSKLTRDFLPSFTFGSQGILLDNEKQICEFTEEAEHEQNCGNFDSMVNIFYENSVNTNKGDWRIRLKPKKLSFKKQLEKKIFKSKKKSIFKNLLSKKFGINSRVKETTSSTKVQSVHETSFKIGPSKKPNKEWNDCDSAKPPSTNRSESPVRLNLLNASLPLAKKLKPRKPKSAKNKMFNFGAKFKVNSPRNNQINNMIHGLNMSRIPSDLIDYNFLSSELNLPRFEASPAPSNPPTIQENSLNFSFNPKLKSIQDTNYSISIFGENDAPEGEKVQRKFTGPTKTSIFETKILSSNNLNGKSYSWLDLDSKASLNATPLASGICSSEKLSINFSILN